MLDETPAPETSSDAAGPSASAMASGGAVPAPPGRASARRRLRWGVTWLLVVLASLCVALSAVAVWSHRVLLNTDTFVATVEPIVRDPAVANALSSTTSEQIVSVLGVDQRAREALPEKARFLAVPLADTVTDVLRDQLARLLLRDDLQDAWLKALSYAHEAAVTVLRGGTRLISTANGEVDLNLFPLIDAGLRLVEKLGILPDDVTLPDLANVTPTEGRARLEQSLGRRLPASFGEVTVLRSAQLAKAQRAVRAFDRLTVALPLATLALAVVALAVSPRRRLTALHLGAGAGLALVLMRAVFRIAGDELVNAVRAESLGSAVAGAGVSTLTDSLTAFTAPLIGAGVVLALAAFLAGRRAWLRAATGWLRVPTGSAEHPSRVAYWLRANITALRLSGLALAVVVLLFASLTWGLLLLCALLLGAYEVALVVLQRGSVART